MKPERTFCVFFFFFKLDGGVPEDCGWLDGSSGLGRIWWQLLLLPAWQNGHAVLFTEIPFRPLPSFDFATQNSLLLNHLHHSGVPTKPRHLKMNGRLSSKRPDIMLTTTRLSFKHWCNSCMLNSLWIFYCLCVVFMSLWLYSCVVMEDLYLFVGFSSVFSCLFSFFCMIDFICVGVFVVSLWFVGVFVVTFPLSVVI